MCLTVPCEVVAVNGVMARVLRSGQTLDVSLMLLDEPVAVGDWVAVQAQRYVHSRLSAEEARQILALYETIAAGVAPTGNPDASA